MNFYVTFGTADYLAKTASEYQNEKMLLMQNEDKGILLHESDATSLFKEPKKYEVLDGAGDFQKGSYAVLNNIPVSDEGKPLFEQRFKERARMIEGEPGFVAIRVLRPVNDDTYVILTLWEDESSFRNWQQSRSFEQAHKKRGTSAGADQKSIFPRPSYVTTYNTVSE
ncbi:antibiotic biosynthesis monooxygenase [Metabacillus dongyingensis]|uniref:antibiotic biosynthesis monooxygenase family protein n=1 Tax=Metabacillus dongyingensis TaxID=2874282 RepID=UPI003B8B090E